MPRIRPVVGRARIAWRMARWPWAFLPGDHYSPIASPEQIEELLPSLYDEPAALRGVDLAADEQLALIDALAPLAHEAPWTMEPDPGLRFFYRNDWFSGSDALVLFALLRHLAPRRLIEVGSGFSSACALDTIERFLPGRVRCTFIDPNPEPLRALLRPEDAATVDVIASPVQAVDTSLFRELEAGDMLFIDSSHVSRVGSDVNWLLFSVIPDLAPGVWIHFHDVFYPFEYPARWLVEGRMWNEAYLLHAFLQYNNSFRIRLFNSYLGQRHHDYVTERMSIPGNEFGGSIWLERTA